MQEDPLLRSLAERIIQGSNYQVTNEEWNIIRERIRFDVATYSLRQNGIPQRKSDQSLKIARDSSMVKKLKKKVQHRCQICDYAISLGGGRYYSEGHHIRPLGNGHWGPDDEDNIIILCPNHHIEFDYGYIFD